MHVQTVLTYTYVYSHTIISTGIHPFTHTWPRAVIHTPAHSLTHASGIQAPHPTRSSSHSLTRPHIFRAHSWTPTHRCLTLRHTCIRARAGSKTLPPGGLAAGAACGAELLAERREQVAGLGGAGARGGPGGRRAGALRPGKRQRGAPAHRPAGDYYAPATVSAQ